MKLKHILIANAIITAFFGLGFVLAPAMQFETFGAQTSVMAETIARSYGASLLGWAVVSWFARNDEPSGARTGLVVASILFHLLGAANLVFAMSAGNINATGWVAVALDVIISAGLAFTQWAPTRAGATQK